MAEQSPQKLEIRKYPNRRYYDTTRSRHVTLEEINTLIRDGNEVRVTDSRTGEDITAKVLAQIILELDSPKLGVFPVPLLHRLIRANEALVTDFVEKYFNQALSAFLDSQRNFEHSMRQVMGLPTTTATLPEWTKLMWGPLMPRWSGGRQPAPPESPSAPPADDVNGNEELRRLVDELRRQIGDLESRVQTPAATAKPRKAGRRGGKRRSDSNGSA